LGLYSKLFGFCTLKFFSKLLFKDLIVFDKAQANSVIFSVPLQSLVNLILDLPIDDLVNTKPKL